MEQDPNQKAGLPLRIFRCEASTEYAKRVMALAEINFSLQCLSRLREMNQCVDSDPLLREALWNAAIVRLFSVFDGPNALKLNLLNEMPEGAHEAFQFFLNYRNKHIAHKVNPIDQVKAGVILSDPTETERRVLGVGNLGTQDASFADPTFVSSLGDFAAALSRRVCIEAKLWIERTLDEAKSRDIDELYRLRSLRVVVRNSGHLKNSGT
ncbi:MAG: hypothetical protein ACREVE_02745 [Gammaproteobacteria bacterium]